MASNKSVKKESLPTSVWMLFMGIIAALMGMGLIGPVLPTLTTQLGASPSEVTLLYSSYNLVMAVGALITGAISTRLGLKRALLVGIVIIGVFATIAGFANNIWTIIGLRGIWAIGTSLFFATGLTAMVTLAGVSKARSIILYEAAIGIGVAAGPLIGGLLGQFSWRYPFIGIGIMMTAVFVLLLFKLPNVKEDIDEEKSGTSLLDPFRAMKHRPIAALGTANCLYNFGFFTLLAYTPLALGLSPFSIGIIFLGWGVLLALSSYYMAPKLQKLFGRIKSLYLMLALFTGLLLVMGIWTSDIWIMSACVVFSGLLFGNSNSLFTHAVMEASPVEASTTSAAFSFLRMIGGIIAPFMAGILAEIYSPNTPFLVGACFVIASILVIVLNRQNIQPVAKVEEKLKEPAEAITLKVRYFMVPDVVSIKLDATIKELLNLLTRHGIGGVPVVDNNNKLMGMVSDGDVIRYLAPKEESVHDFVYSVLVEEGETEQKVLNEKNSATVNDLMRRQQIYAVKEEDTFEKAIQILSRHHFKKIPVLDGEGKVTGIVSRGDIDNKLMEILSK